MPRIEVLPQSKASHVTPGWAYVTESAAPNPAHYLLPQAPAGGKRAAARAALDNIVTTPSSATAAAAFIDNNDRSGGGGPGGAKTQTPRANKMRSRWDDLAKDSARRAEVDVPAALLKEMNEGRWKANDDDDEMEGGGGKRQKHNASKMTTNVKRVLTSAKTWAHHAADEEVRVQALQAKEKDNRYPHHHTISKSNGTTSSQAPIDSLLRTNLPEIPSEEVISALIRGPPLSYAAIAAGPSTSKVPARKFCAMCGHWGKVKCVICGTYICGLDCRTSHYATEHPHR